MLVISMYRVIQIVRAHKDGSPSRPCLLADKRAMILTLLPNTHSVISVHFPSRWSRASTYICKAETLAFTDYDYCYTFSAVSVVKVIIGTCDMPRQGFSLCQRVYIHNTYKKCRKSCTETRRKFRVKFPGGLVPNPSTIRRQAKRLKEKGSVKNRKVNRRCHVLTEERWDESSERLENNPPKVSKSFITGNWSICVCTKSNKMTEITYTYCEYTHIHTMRIPV